MLPYPAPQWPLGNAYIFASEKSSYTFTGKSFTHPNKHMFHMKFQPQRLDLVGGWTNPLWKICSSKMGSVHLPQISGWKYPKKYLKLTSTYLNAYGVKLPLPWSFFSNCTKTCRFWEFAKVTHPFPCLGCSSMVMGKSTRCISPRRIFLRWTKSWWMHK